MGYLFAAYTVFWALLAVYLLLLTRKTNRALAEIERLKRQYERNRPGADIPDGGQPGAH